MNWKHGLLVVAIISGARAEIRFNEVCYDPEGTDTGAEWIELINTGSQAVSLDGWLLDCSGPNLILPAVTLAAGQVLVIHNNAVADLPPSGNEIWFAGPNLGNTHAFLGLWNSEDQSGENLVDYLEYGSGLHSYEGQAVEMGLWTVGAFLPDVEQGHSLQFRGSGTGPDAWEEELEPVPGVTTTVLAHPDQSLAPRNPDLLDVWPNPFNPDTQISFRLYQIMHVRLSLVDLLGREVKLIADERLSTGLHQRRLELSEQPAGPYFLRLQANGSEQVRKILFLK